MRKIRMLTLMLCIAVSVLGAAGGAAAEEKAKSTGKTAAASDLAPNARSAILMDAGTGTIIYEKTVTTSCRRPASPKL